ncbi:MAG: AgmX/PglI C-terminal domain-containing protein [Gammaproteobacteria bacterium]|nr:AgmX/PglI C-terminal domain-containing protein [Gammaproteobacteria bacterium]
MSARTFYYRSTLPWTTEKEDERFRLILLSTLLVLTILGAVFSWVHVPPPSREDIVIPPRLAKLIMQEKPKPPPPPPPPVVEPAEPLPAPPPPVEQKKAEPKPAPEPPPKKAVVLEQAAPPPSAREKAARSGLLALRDELADLRTDTVASALEGQPLRKSATADSAAGDTSRSIITSQATAGSGGINTGRLSRDTGGTQLAGRETTRVTAPAGEAAAGAGGGTEAATGKAGPAGARSSEEIQMVFDRNKGTLNAIYNRALRQNPALAGKVVLKLTIAPDGTVSQCELVSSELNDPELERKLIARVQLFDFGKKSAAATTITYPIDFFPG